MIKHCPLVYQPFRMAATLKVSRPAKAVQGVWTD